MKATSGPKKASDRAASTALGAAVFVLLFGFSAKAQLGLPGPAQKVLDVYPAPTGYNYNADGVDSAYDPANGVYLTLAAVNHVTGVWVSPLGVPIGGLSPVAIKPPSTTTTISGVTCSSSSKPFGAFARAAYSPQLGGFLVAWSEEEHPNRPTAACGGPSTVPARPRVYMRTVKYPNILGPVRRITDATAHLTYGNLDLAYSETSQRFLVAFNTGGGPFRIRVQAVDVNGNLLGGSIQVSETLASGVTAWGTAPSVTWNPVTNHFGVGYSGELGNGSAFFSGFVRVPADNPGAFARTIFNKPAAGQTAQTDINYIPSTGRYLMTWWEPARARVAEINASGVVTNFGTASTVVGKNSYNSHSSAYNPSSGTVLLVGAMPGTIDNVGGAELNHRGYRISADMTLVVVAEPARYIRVSARTDARAWMPVYSLAQKSLWDRPVVSSTPFGGGSAAFPAYGSTSPTTTTPPPPPPPDSGGGTVTCTNSAPVAGWVCVGNNSWVPPDHPLALALAGGSGGSGGSTGGTGGTGGSGGGGTVTVTCTNSAPVAGWVCVGNNSWVPPDHPLALALVSGGSSGGSTGGTTCTTPSPGVGWVCNNGSWFPPDHPGAGLPVCTNSAGAPGSGWVKVGSSWVPADHPLAAQGTCRAA